MSDLFHLLSCRDNSPDKDEDDNDDTEYPSISSLGSGGSSGSGGLMSPRSDPLHLGPNSLTDTCLGPLPQGPHSILDSMVMMDQVLSNGGMDRLEKINRLEAILAAGTSEHEANYASNISSPCSPVPLSTSLANTLATSPCCSCNCHTVNLSSGYSSLPPGLSSPSVSSTVATTPSSPSSSKSPDSPENRPRMGDSQCQTLSTGDIVITKVYFSESDNIKDMN